MPRIEEIVTVRGLTPEMKLCVISGFAGPTGGTMALMEILGQNKYGYTLWKDKFKREIFTERSWPVPAFGSVYEEFYMEGKEISGAKKDIMMYASMSCPSGGGYLPVFASQTAFSTVWEADLDIDSENLWGIEEPEDWGLDTAGDKIEHCEEDARPGKIMITTIGKDTDLDGTPDFADGLGLPEMIGASTSGGVGPGGERTAKLVPVRVHLREPIKPKDAKVRFDYTASIPRLDSDQGDIVIQGSGSADSPHMYFLKTSGLRIWAWDAPHRPDSIETGKNITPRVPQRKFVQPAQDIAWRDLCAAVEGEAIPDADLPRELVLYLEYAEAPQAPVQTGSAITGGVPAARPSGIADMRKAITFTETAESNGLATDEVHVTLAFIELDVNGNRSANGDRSVDDPCDGFRRYLPGYELLIPKLHDLTKTSFETAAFKQTQGADCGGMKIVLMGVGTSVVDKAEFEITRTTSASSWGVPGSFCENGSKAGLSVGTEDFSFAESVDKKTIEGTIEERMVWAPIYCKDYGAFAEVEIKLFMGTKQIAQPILVRLPFDYNDDSIADIWQYKQITAWNQRYPGTPPIPTNAAGLGHFAPDSDPEMADSDGTGPLPPPPNPSCPYPPMAADGDGLTVHEEYRGYIFDGGPGVTPGGHKRLSAARKELLVECSEMDGIASVGGSLPPDSASGFTDQGNGANTFAQGYTIVGTMGAVYDFFGKEGAPTGSPDHFPGAILDTYWVRDRLNDMATDLVYNTLSMRSAYKYSGPYTINSQTQGNGWLSIAFDNELLMSNENRCRQLYGGGEGVSILGNDDNRNDLCRQFIKLAVQGRKGRYDNDGNARIQADGFALEVDETNPLAMAHGDSAYRYQGSALFVNSISEEAVWANQTAFSERLAWAFAHELGHLFIFGRDKNGAIAPFAGGEHISGNNNLMNNAPPPSLSSCLFHESEITHTNLPQRASVNKDTNALP